VNGKRVGLCVVAAALAAAGGRVAWRAWRERPAAGVTICLSHFQLEGTVRNGIAAVIRRYEQLHPGVHVVQLVVPGTLYVEWMRAQLTGGTAPDLMEYTIWWGHLDELAPRYFRAISAEVTQPNPYNRGTPLEGVPWRDTFVDDMNGPDGYVADLGQFYAPTIATFTLRVFYNRTLLRAITGRDDPPRNWREFLALAAQARAYGQATHRVLYPLANSGMNCRYFAGTVLQGLGGRVDERIDHRHALALTYEDAVAALVRGEWSYRTPEVADGLEVFREIGGASQPGFIQATVDVAMLHFLRGNALMFCSGTWDASSLRQLADFEVGACRIPLPDRADPQYGPDVQGPLSDGAVRTANPIYLNQASPHRDVALDFLRFLTSQEGNQIFVDVSQWAPAVRGVRPSRFAEQFMPFYEGYCWDPTTSFFYDGTGNEMTNVFLSQMNLLFGPGGSVRAMQEAMERLRPAAMDSDLKSYLRDTRGAFDGEDADYAVRYERDPGDLRLLAPAALVEAQYYQIAELERALTRSAGERGGPPAAPGRAVPGDDSPAPRPERFARAVRLLVAPPVSESQVDQAREILTGLAAGGADDAALGARYFLGRIAQRYQAEPDLAEAARQFRGLVAARRDSRWAQTALTRLAILEIYGLDLERPPAARIAAAEKLLAAATDPAAASELHLVLEDAIFHYQLPSAAALPHLLAAEKLGRLDDPTRADVLVQIAEVSALLGDTAQARTYYEKLLANYPRDQRHYMVRQKLAALALIRSR
jgi:ABC-type glycerol-3-phosphate transport system substrate-binding protein